MDSSPISNAQSVLTTKWVLRLKEALDENFEKFEKYKACLVTRGYEQIHGIDYNKTFASVVKFITLRLSLAIRVVDDLVLQCCIK